MSYVPTRLPPFPDADLTRMIATWVQGAPRRMLIDLVDDQARLDAANALGELIVAELTMAYPELVESSAPRLPF